MTSPPDGAAGFLVLDPDLPRRPPVARTASYSDALAAVDRLQEQFHDQVDANGEGGAATVLRLVVVPVDGDGRPGAPVHWSSVNGIRPRSSR